MIRFDAEAEARRDGVEAFEGGGGATKSIPGKNSGTIVKEKSFRKVQ
jgi:hypothetical protein